MWWESLLPMGIIAGMLVIMGTSQDLIHKAVYGKPKHPCSDAWDRAMEQRDYRILKEAEAEQKQS